MEAWGAVDGGLVSDGTVKDVCIFLSIIPMPRTEVVTIVQILYGLPVSVNKLDDLSVLWDEIAPLGAAIRILVDHPDQVHLLNEYEKARPNPRRWSIFIKIDAGYQCVNLFGM